MGDDDFGKDSIEGSYSLSLKEAIEELVTEGKWYNLVGCKSGKVYISTSYTFKENQSIEKHKQLESQDMSEEATPKYDSDQTKVQAQSSQEEESPFVPGVLELTMHRASELVNKDKIGKSDPYVKVRYNDKEFRSKTIANTLEPEWNFSCKLDIMNLEEKYIDINIYDDDFGRDNIEGCYSLPVKEAINELITEGKWYNLVGCKSGKVYISTSYTTIKMENKSTEKPVESTSNDNSKDEVEPFKENKKRAEKERK